MSISLYAFAPENLVSRDGFGSPVPRQPAHLYTQAESGAYLRDSSRVPRRRPFIYLKTIIRHRVSPELSGHAIAYRCRSLARVRRHRASKPQGSSERVLPWQVAMNQLICASLSHTHYWYKVAMLKVPADMSLKRKQKNETKKHNQRATRTERRRAFRPVAEHVAPLCWSVWKQNARIRIRKGGLIVNLMDDDPSYLLVIIMC